MGKASDTGGLLEKEQTERPEVGRPTQRHDETTTEAELTRMGRGQNGKMFL